MARGRSVAVGAAAIAAAVAVASGVAFGVSQLAGAEDAPDVAVPATAPVTPHASQTPEETQPPTETPAPTEPATPTPTSTALFKAGDTGDGVRELQARLKQIAWYEPKINGEFDDVTRQSVEGFQAKRGFEVTGEVDQQTWDKLASMTREPTDDELHNRVVAGPTIIGPDDTGDRVRELQARLRQIGWFEEDVTGNYGPVTKEAVAGFQTKRGIPSTGEVDQKTWDLLVGMTRTPTDDELHNRKPAGTSDGSLPQQCQTGRVLCIDKTGLKLRWVIEGQVKSTFDARFGSELTPTREGSFSVYWKSRDHVSSLYDTPMPYAMFFDGGQAVHYSPDFAAHGYNGASHGCVNIRDKAGIAALFDQVNVGDKVFVYRS